MHAFFIALTGRKPDGNTPGSGENRYGNTKLVSFYNVGENEINSERTALVDAFGNVEIVVLYDKNGDGRITTADGARQAVTGSNGDTFTPDDANLDMTKGVRAGVIFYSAGNGLSVNDLIYSWK